MRLPHPAIIPPIGEGKGAAWASLNINFLRLVPGECCQSTEFLSLCGFGYAIMHVIRMMQPNV